MPINIRKDGMAKRLATNILGPPRGGLTDSWGNKKRFVQKRDAKDAETLYQERLEGEKINNFQEVGYRW